MQKTRKLHLADFVRLAERFSASEHDTPRVRARHPDEEVRVARWTSMYPNLPGWTHGNETGHAT